jgi:hypothetical protein
MKTFGFVVPLLLLLAPAAATAQNAAPLFAGFQTFCVATGGDPVAVEDAVEAAGGKSHGVPDDYEPGSAVSIAAWEYRLGDEDMTIVAGTQSIPDAHGGPPRDATACIIEGEARDDAGAAAIKQWVAVPPSRVMARDATVTWFDFRVGAGGVRMPVPSDRTAYDTAVAAGQIWSLVLRQSQTVTSVQLVHIVPERR